jgi:hypothetical protein
MTRPDAFPVWTACTSALRLDRWLAAELAPAEAREVSRHVAACPRCGAAAEALRVSRAEVLPPLRAGSSGAALPSDAEDRPAAVTRAPARRWRVRVRVLAGAGAAAALAAGLVIALVTGPGPGPATALKGSGFGVVMYVQHAGEVRRAANGEAVAPGDAIRFAVSTPVPRYVAVLSLDPRGRASVYYPAGPRAEAVAPGVETALPAGTRLDESVGEERIWTLFCAAPIELEPVRGRLERRGDLGDPPDGCGVSGWRFVKR